MFLLSGIGTLLGVFSTRLGRVADRVDHLLERVEAADLAALDGLSAQLAHLRRRSRLLDQAVILGALAGAATCAATFTLFVGALRDRTAAAILYALFGSALLFTLAAITAFLLELLLANRGTRQRASRPGPGSA